jgi:hypothetical protein
MTATAPRPDSGGDEAAGGYASPFDALRAVGDVQRQAVDSASQVIARFLGLVDAPSGAPGAPDSPGRGPAGAERVGPDGRDGAGGTEPAGGDPGPGPQLADGDLGFARVRADMGRAVDLYIELFRRTFDAYADLTEATLRRRGVTVTGPAPAGAAGDHGAPLTLAVGATGIAHGTVWLHNATDEPTTPEALRPTALTAHAGAEIPAGRVTVDPAPLPATGPDASAEATVTVDARGAAPGRYVGHLLSTHGALPVTVDVHR